MSKAEILLGDSTLLDRLLVAVSGCRTVVVGDAVDAPVLTTREVPPGGGPAAGVAAGFAALRAGEDEPPDPPGSSGRDVLVLAVDQPGITAQTVQRLRAAIPADRSAGACLVSSSRRHYAAAALPFRPLAVQLGSRPSWHDRALRSLIDPILSVEVPATGDEARDIDTIEDLRYWTERTAGAGSADAQGTGRDGMDP